MEPKKPFQTFQIRADRAFIADLEAVIKNQQDNPNRSEMIRRLVRFAAATKLQVPRSEE